MAFWISRRLSPTFITFSCSLLYRSHPQVSVRPSFHFPLILPSIISNSDTFTSVSSSSHTIATSFVFQNSCQNHKKLSVLANFRRPSIPKCVWAHGFCTIPESDISPAMETEIKKTKGSILALKWAFAAECVVQLVIRACTADLDPIPVAVSIQSFAACTVPLCMTMKVSSSLRRMQWIPSRMNMEEDLEDALQEALEESDSIVHAMFAVAGFGALGQSLPLCWMLTNPGSLMAISNAKIYLLSLSAFHFPFFCSIPIFVMVFGKDRRAFRAMVSNRGRELQFLKMVNRFLVRSWIITFCSAGLSSLILLYMIVLH